MNPVKSPDFYIDPINARARELLTEITREEIDTTITKITEYINQIKSVTVAFVNKEKNNQDPNLVPIYEEAWVEFLSKIHPIDFPPHIHEALAAISTSPEVLGLAKNINDKKFIANHFNDPMTLMTDLINLKNNLNILKALK